MAHSHFALRLLAFALLIGFAPAPQAHAAPATKPTNPPAAPAPLVEPRFAVPPLLAPWVPWVLDAAGDARCPQVFEQRVCVWPSALSLEVIGNSASFQLRVFAERDDVAVTLPGSGDHWPIDVRVDGSPAPVREPAGVPTVDVTRGTHTVSGRFLFAEAPSALRIPAQVGALSLRRNGVSVAQPRREPNGLLWIEERGHDDEREERLSLSVHRRIADGVPLVVTTRVAIQASGKSREIAFDSVLLPGSRPIELSADVPTQLTPSGGLRLQIEGGSHRVEIVAVVDAPVTKLLAPKLPAPWPEQEVWVFRANDSLRHVEVRGPSQVDAARTDLASDWRGLPTFLVAPGQALALEVRRRGESEPAPNRLRLERALWLDLDGDGYTVRDQLRGSLRQGFRLDLEQGELGRAVVDGSDALITRRAGRSGVELRGSELDLVAEWRLEHGQRELPAVGYSEDVESLATTLHLPPGYMLLAAQGTDSAYGTWTDRWNLFDFFFVLALALAVGKLAGVPWAVLALLALVLAQHQPDAPGVSWFFLVASCALTRALDGQIGRAATFARWLLAAALIAFLLAWVPFAAAQIRGALYPQLADASPVEFGDTLARQVAPPGSAPEAGEEAKTDALMESATGGALRDESRGAEKRKPKKAASSLYSTRDLIDPNAAVQTGPGIPNWTFHQFQFAWTGPVTRAERVQLWLLPPYATRMWALGAAVLTGLLLFGLLNAVRRTAPPDRPTTPPPARSSQPHRPGSAGSDVVVTMLCLALLFVPRSAHAQALEPSPPLLEELRQRLLAPPRCAPDCLSVPTLSLQLSARRLDVQLEVHASEAATYRAPGPLAHWPIDRVRIDGVEALASARLEDGFLHVRVPAGIHRLELSGSIANDQTWSLALGGPVPHRVEAHGKGWIIEGLHADGSAEPNLELRPDVARDAAGPPELPLTPWLEVRRELELGLRFQIRTTLTRLGPAYEGVLVRVPLLPDETVHEADFAVEEGEVLVSLPRNQSSLSFASSLPARAQVSLQAAQPMIGGVLRHPFSEHWIVRPSPLYHVRMEGISALGQVESGSFAPSYRPWPGERVRLFIERLPPVPGASVTIDRVDLAARPGARSEELKLTFSLRTSRGTSERVILPARTKLASVLLDGTPHSARVHQDVLELPFTPGTHTAEITLQRAAGLAFAYHPELPRLERALSNAHVSVALPSERWLLATSGPAWGPAILWWGHLALVCLIAVGLGRVPGSPLRTWQWTLLGFGLSQVETPVALIVVGWFFALAYRERSRIENVRWFYLVQVLLVLFTLTALACLAHAVHQGLLIPPDMQVQGMQSNQNFVQWYVDRTAGQLPEITVWSAPVWIYKCMMLLWALWLAVGLVQWLRWGWVAFRKDPPFRPGPSGPFLSRRVRAPAGGPSHPGGGADSERAGVP